MKNVCVIVFVLGKLNSRLAYILDKPQIESDRKSCGREKESECLTVRKKELIWVIQVISSVCVCVFCMFIIFIDTYFKSLFCAILNRFCEKTVPAGKLRGDDYIWGGLMFFGFNF